MILTPRGEQNSAYRSASHIPLRPFRENAILRSGRMQNVRAVDPPKALRPGGTIAVAAASGPSDRARIEQAARRIEARGYRVTIAGNVDHRWRGYLAGTDEERVAELNHYLRSDCDAIFFARGGYGAMRILDRVDFEALRRNPRP